MLQEALIQERRIFVGAGRSKLHLVSRAVPANADILFLTEFPGEDILQKQDRLHAVERADTSAAETVRHIFTGDLTDLLSRAEKRSKRRPARAHDRGESVI